MLFLDGVYVNGGAAAAAAPIFHRVPASTTVQRHCLLDRISQRIGRYLERQGLLVCDPENDYLQLDSLDEEASCMDSLRGHSVVGLLSHHRLVLPTNWTVGLLRSVASSAF